VVVLGLENNSRNSVGSGQTAPELVNGAAEADAVSHDDSSDARNIELTQRLLSSVQRHVLAGDAFIDLSEKLTAMRAHLGVASDPYVQARQIAELDSVLELFQARVKESNRETALDFKKLLNLVNETFSCMQSGTEKSDARLKYLEQTLGQAAKMDSLASLRRHVSGVLDFVRQEGKRDLDEKGTQFKSVADQIRLVHEATSRFRVHMPGRAEALDHFKEVLADHGVGPETNVTLFAADSLKHLRTRHGDEIASNILEELARKEVQPLAPEGRLFCWSGTSLALTWRHIFGSTSAGLLNPAPSVFEHRAFVGTRVATFKIAIRSGSTPVAGGLEDVISTLDRFSKEASQC
jgi:hypothetical protein